MKLLSATDLLLRKQRRRSRGTLLAWAAAAALFTQVGNGAIRLGWMDASLLWAFVPAIASVILLARWFYRVRRLDDRALARELDARWEFGARLESTLELATDDSVLAQAQRTDTSRRIAAKGPFGTPAWAGGIAAVSVALGLIALEQIALHTRSSSPPSTQSPSTAIAGNSATLTSVATPPAPLRVSIVWKSPARSITAKALDELLLLAHVESNWSLRPFSLEVSVNGAHFRSYPLPASVSDTWKQPGERDLNLSLFLDETGAQLGDFVIYHLKTEANAGLEISAIVSSRQFVEIVPVDFVAGADTRFSSDAQELLRRFTALKQAQLQLFDRNFGLTHLSPGGSNFDPTTENAEVTVAQTRLAQPAEEARAFAARIRAPDLVAIPLTQATALMTQAGLLIGTHQNEAAAPLQSKALISIIAAERAFRASLETEISVSAPSIAQSLGSKPSIQRSQTPAGRLEQLAERQFTHHQKLQSEKPELPRLAREQLIISQDLKTLEAERGLIEPVQTLLAVAVKAAAEAARQLALNDPQAAREPSARAQLTLKRAVELQESEGRKTAAALLEQIREETNRTELPAPAIHEAVRTRATEKLNAEAARQLFQGSEEAAKKLKELSEGMTWGKPAKLEAMRLRPIPNDDGEKNVSRPSAEKPGAGPSLFLDLLPEYVAELKPRPDASRSMGSGRAKLFLVPGLSNLYATARVSVTFDNLTSAQTAADLLVEKPDGTRTPVFAFDQGKSVGQSWAFQPVDTLSHDDFIRAIKAGRLSLRITSTTYPLGELEGTFLKDTEIYDNAGRPVAGLDPRSPEQKGLALQGALLLERASQTQNSSRTLAQAEARLTPDASSARAIRQLKAAAAQLSANDDNSAALDLIQRAAQMAEGLTTGSPLGDTAHQLAQNLENRLSDPHTLDAVARQTFADQALALAQALETARPTAKRDEWARRYAPEEIDPVYRRTVENYFEHLSREGVAR